MSAKEFINKIKTHGTFFTMSATISSPIFLLTIYYNNHSTEISVQYFFIM